MNPDFLRKAGYLVFSCAFIMALRIFGQVGSSVFSRETAIWLFMMFGAFGFILNLINQRKIEKQRYYHLLFWMGSSIALIGFGMKLLRFDFHWWVIGLGMAAVLSSFFFTGEKEPQSREDLLDDSKHVN
jgi:hypothetical protein